MQINFILTTLCPRSDTRRRGGQGNILIPSSPASSSSSMVFIKSYYDKTNPMYGDARTNTHMKLREFIIMASFASRGPFPATIQLLSSAFSFPKWKFISEDYGYSNFQHSSLQLFSCHIGLGLTAPTRMRKTTITRTIQHSIAFSGQLLGCLSVPLSLSRKIYLVPVLIRPRIWDFNIHSTVWCPSESCPFIPRRRAFSLSR